METTTIKFYKLILLFIMLILGISNAIAQDDGCFWDYEICSGDAENEWIHGSIATQGSITPHALNNYIAAMQECANVYWDC